MTTELTRPARKPRKRTKYMPCPASLANLKAHEYKPGENGHGRVYPLKERLRHALDKPSLDAIKVKTLADQVVIATIEGAIKREPSPFNQLWDRVDGKVPDKTLPNERPVVTNFIFILPDGTKVSPRALIEVDNRVKEE